MNTPQLPAPGADAAAASAALVGRIQEALLAAGGWLPFSDYMRLALYSPGLGYYSGGAAKFGAEGDFTTAPELSPLFGACIADTAAAVLAALAEQGRHGDVLEFGAGTGKLAAQLLLGLERLGRLPARYSVVDLSGELRERQRATIATSAPHLLDRVEWLDALPETFTGFVVGNEVLDAMPCALVHRDAAGRLFERGVVRQDGALGWQDRPLTAGPLHALATALELPNGYTTEIQPEMHAFVRSVAGMLSTGAVLWLDYGFAHAEYYHPERHMGTLIGHYRHHTVHDPFFWPGLTDLTCHVDFSAVYREADAAGLALEGYAPQAQYLLGAGLLDKLAALGPDHPGYLAQVAAVQKLTSPAEMGDLFKAIAFSKDLPLDALLPGFDGRDDSHKL
ncbi:class I SAM-dependent methyltransferase [Jeongeupia chitinilytica]|uniref:SAM-dependent methyltransferase n=1 Tax=Jeongeupia chitinilytica TaxID=1041641 RepID=A0ABQ3H270_9NEIS|nr:SAM-dependent methyltransferase [Jeongeupia chitinilytica]GHD66552.1 SAM-dependent methyltransferase [Jeongeupia chitinilytica]